jgi:hypothetical protein
MGRHINPGIEHIQKIAIIIVVDVAFREELAV